MVVHAGQELCGNEPLALLRFEQMCAAMRVLRAAKNFSGNPAFSTVDGHRVLVSNSQQIPTEG